MHFPKISIVTPSYNQGQYIEQTILSVLNQNYPNLEYIIIDGGSTDNTIEIVKKYADKISYWISEPDKGQADAINKGFEKCTGEIFNWINSDDYYEPNTFEQVVKLFNAKQNVQAVCGKEWGFMDTMHTQKILHKGSVIKDNIYDTIRVGIIDQPCTFFRKAILDSIFPLNESLRYVMDKQLWWRFLLKQGQSNIIQTDEIFTNFRLHPNSKSIAEGNLFYEEEDSLRLCLFRFLKAPEILVNQLSVSNNELVINWEIGIKNIHLLIANFISFYAERSYVQNDLSTTGELMKIGFRLKKYNLSKTDFKLFLLSSIFPHKLSFLLKKIKN